jgi:putative acetyltransferase
MGDGRNVVIRLISEIGEDVRDLIGELDLELSNEYSEDQRHGLDLSQLLDVHMRFYVIYSDGEAAGCGGVGFYDDFAEVKRFYVRPDHRGKGLADLLLRHIEEVSRDARYRWLRLETGTKQVAAIQFYLRHGFEQCLAFGHYLTLTRETLVESLFFEKVLVVNK